MIFALILCCVFLKIWRIIDDIKDFIELSHKGGHYI